MNRTKYKKVQKLSETERAYLAGIIDGEGTITLTVKQKGATRHLAVTVSGTEKTLFSYIVRCVGAGQLTHKRIYKSHHTPSYTYSIYSRQALDLLQQVTPFLKTYKQRRAKLALDRYLEVTPRNGKYTELSLREKEKFVEQFFSILP